MIDGTKLPYADTKVSIERSREEIDHLLKKFGCKGIQWTWIDNSEILRFIHEFDYKGVNYGVGYEIILPEMGIKRGRGYDKTLVRNDQQAYRITFYTIKAKLTSVESGLETFENVFMSNIMYKLPDGRVQKVGDIIIDQITKIKPIDLLES